MPTGRLDWKVCFRAIQFHDYRFFLSLQLSNVLNSHRFLLDPKEKALYWCVLFSLTSVSAVYPRDPAFPHSQLANIHTGTFWGFHRFPKVVLETVHSGHPETLCPIYWASSGKAGMWHLSPSHPCTPFWAYSACSVGVGGSSLFLSIHCLSWYGRERQCMVEPQLNKCCWTILSLNPLSLWCMGIVW